MEITALKNTNHVSQISNPSSKIVSKVTEKPSDSQLNDSKSEGTVSNQQKANPDISISTINNSISTNLNAETTILSSLANSAKLARFKTSDRLSKVIEKCKRLQRLSDQNSSKPGDDKAVSVIPPTVPPEQVTANCESTQKVLPEVTDATVSIQKLPEKTSVSPSHANIESGVSSSSCVDSSKVLQDSNHAVSRNTPEGTFKKFLFLFRPSDHEVLVRHKGVNMYRCNVCDGMYRQKFSLKRHFLRSHINFQYISKSDLSNCKIAIPDDFVPLDCDPDSPAKKNFKSSNAVFFENNEARVMPGLYTCNICVGVKFDRELDLRQHYSRHSDARKKYQCDKCGASFYKKQILSRHLASHGAKIVKKECRRCGSGFSSKDEYQKHMISHSSGRVCKFCSKILSTSANRKRHEALHLGLKPYRCTHCGMCFAQSKDLDRHLKKQHSDVCHFCDKCNKLFPSLASLDVHKHEKHTDHAQKTDVATSQNQQGSSTNGSKPEPIKVTLPIKLKICLVCKRSFSTFYAMVKHRSQAHPYYTKRRRNRKTMKQKLAQQAAAQAAGKLSKPGPPVRRGRPPLDKSVRFSQPCRPGSRWMSKREKEMAKKEELEFYVNLSEKIAENLLHYVDGKPSQLSLNPYNLSNHNVVCNFEERGKFPWSNYNFPAGYDVEKALKARGHEVKNDNMPQNLSNRDKCLYATGLSSVKKLKQMGKDIASNKNESNKSITEAVRIQVNGIDMKKLNLEERRKLIGKKMQVICLCRICGKKCDTKDAFEEHRENNHQNVECPCIEIEVENETALAVPEELCSQKISADGLFFSCNVPPLISEATTLKCTKCKSNFQTSSDLHSHLVTCGNLKSSPTHAWKVRKHKRIKRTMKNRISSTEQQSALHKFKKDILTEVVDLSGKKESLPNIAEKVSKPAEKSQFYKNGRSQAKSFTVGMNYFKTKPVKPPNDQPSKRGRKSYATLSFRFKNASMQSVSNQCSFCKETFSSPHALNMHLQSHMSSQSKGKEKHFDDSATKALNIDANKTSGVQNLTLNTFDPKAVGSSVAVSKSHFSTNHPSNKSSLLNQTAIISPLVCFKTKNASITPKMLVESSTKQPTTLNKSLNVAFSAKHRTSIETPVDLRRSNNLPSVHSTTSGSMNYRTPTKSALDIAMAAVQEFSLNLEQNEHISKLQKTVEKLTPPSKTSAVQVTSVSPRRPGRPKKVQNSITDPSKKTLFPENRVNLVIPASKPVSKLEETVKRLAESKAKACSNLSKESASPSKVVTINITTKPLQPPPQTVNSVQTLLTPPKTVAKAHSLPVPPVGPTTNITLNSATKFVPILIYSTPNKPVNILGLTPNLNSSSISITPALPKTISGTSASVSATNSAGSTSSKLVPDKAVVVQGVNVANKINDPNSGSPEKKIEAASPTSSGRISPSLESIVNSIKQKLHSQDSPPHTMSWLEDEKFDVPKVTVSQLSAETVSAEPPLLTKDPVISQTDAVINSAKEVGVTAATEIPRTTPKVAEKSNPDEKLTEKSVCSENISLDQPVSATDPKLVEKASNLLLNEDDLSQKGKLKSLPNDVASEDIEPGKAEDCVSNKVQSIDLKENNVSKKLRKMKKYRKKRRELFTLRKNRTVKQKKSENIKELIKEKSTEENLNAIKSSASQYLEPSTQSGKKGEGKEKKLLINQNDENTNVPKLDMLISEENVCVDRVPCQNHASLDDTLDSSPLQPEDKKLIAGVPQSISKMKNAASKSDASLMKSVSSPKESALLNPSCSSAQQELHPKTITSDEIPPTLNSNNPLANTSDAMNNEPIDSLPDAKNSSNSCMDTSVCDYSAAGGVQQSDNAVSESVILNSNSAQQEQINPVSTQGQVTTEFGRSLATRMKEKMRQSFENATFDTQFKSEESKCGEKSLESSLPGVSFSANNTNAAQIRAIKREFEVFEPNNRHSCPFCMLEFSYLTNFRRHLKVCRARFMMREVQPLPSNNSPLPQYLPKKHEVEHSMLNLLRHQSRQTQLLKEVQKSSGSKVSNKFRTYSCKYCHRIYLSLFKLLQHQVTHKLSSTDLVTAKEGENVSVSDMEEKKFVPDISQQTVESSAASNKAGETEKLSKEDAGSSTVAEVKEAESVKRRDKFDELLSSGCVSNSSSENVDSLSKTRSADSNILVNAGVSTEESKAADKNKKDSEKCPAVASVGWRKNPSRKSPMPTKAVETENHHRPEVWDPATKVIEAASVETKGHFELNSVHACKTSNGSTLKTDSTESEKELKQPTISTQISAKSKRGRPFKRRKKPFGKAKSVRATEVKISYKKEKVNAPIEKGNNELETNLESAGVTNAAPEKLNSCDNTMSAVSGVFNDFSKSARKVNAKLSNKKPGKNKRGMPRGWRKNVHPSSAEVCEDRNVDISTETAEGSSMKVEQKDTVLLKTYDQNKDNTLLANETYSATRSMKSFGTEETENANVPMNTKKRTKKFKWKKGYIQKRKVGRLVGWRKNTHSKCSDASATLTSEQSNEEMTKIKEEASTIKTNDQNDELILLAQVSNSSAHSIESLCQTMPEDSHIQKSSAKVSKKLKNRDSTKQSVVNKAGRSVGWRKGLSKKLAESTEDLKTEISNEKKEVCGLLTKVNNTIPIITYAKNERVDHDLSSSVESAKVIKSIVKTPTPLNSEEFPKQVAPEKSMKLEPVKRKRGRPVGWRKQLHAVPAVKIRKPLRSLQSNFKSKSGLQKKKFFNSRTFKPKERKIILRRSESIINKIDSKTKGKTNALQQFDFTPENECPPSPAPLRGFVSKSDSKYSSSTISSSPLATSKKIFKKAFNRKWSTAKRDKLGHTKSALPKQLKEGALVTNLKQTEDPKGSKTEQPLEELPVTKKGKSVTTSNTPSKGKKKLGRPPKLPYATPGTSKLTGFSQSRVFRKTVSRTIVIDDDSDSEDEPIKTNSLQKKKPVPLKPCPHCKEKFSASLILYRHIQLVHKRQSSQNARKASPQTTPSSKNVARPVEHFPKVDTNVSPKSVMKIPSIPASEPSRTSNSITQLQPIRIRRSMVTQSKLTYSISSDNNVESLLSKRENNKLSVSDLTLFESKTLDDRSSSKTDVDDEIEIIETNHDDGDITIINDSTSPKKAYSITTSTVSSNQKLPLRTTTSAQRKVKAKPCMPIFNLTSKPERIENVSSYVAKVEKAKVVRKSLPNLVHGNMAGMRNAQTYITGARGRRSLKRIASSSTVDDSSDVDSVKSLTKTDSLSSSSGGSRILKRLKTRLVTDSNSDSDSVKNFPEDSPLALYRSFSQGGFDAEPSRKFKRVAARVQSSLSSETDSHKKTRGVSTKVIPIHVTEEDNDVSIIAISPASDFYACSVCNVNFPRSVHLQKHMRLEHSSDSSSSSPKQGAGLSKQVTVCPICKGKFPTRLSLSTHMRMKHNQKLGRVLLQSSTSKLPVLPLNAPNRSKTLGNSTSRSALSRQCVKPLASLKAQKGKKDLSS